MAKSSPFAPRAAPSDGLDSRTDATQSVSSSVSESSRVRLMPLGDSLTEGETVPGGYRILLKALLAEAGYVTKFVGSKRNGMADLLAGDCQHEGHSGWRIDEIRMEVRPWLERSRPEVVLLTIGTNDVAQGYVLDRAVSRLATLADCIVQTCPTATLMVATIPPISVPRLDQLVQQYNDELRQWARWAADQGEPVELVDLYPVLQWSDLPDGFHPSRAGYDKMARAWAKSLGPVLDQRRAAAAIAP